MIPIYNIKDYTKKMNLSIEDKLFFVDKINTKIFVDYGCADGSLLQALDNLYQDKECVYIGYDISDEMIKLAKSKWSGVGLCYFTSNFDEILNLIQKFKPYKFALIFSSVLHEILSQNNNQEEFLCKIADLNPRYIIIRDMAYNQIISNHKVDNYEFVTLECRYPKLYKDFFKKDVKRNSINFVHFLLKYRYIQNWDRELEENYFAFNPDLAIKQLQSLKYNIVYLERFNVPFIRDRIYEDLRIDINNIGQTHVKLIFQNNGS